MAMHAYKTDGQWVLAPSLAGLGQLMRGPRPLPAWGEAWQQYAESAETRGLGFSVDDLHEMGVTAVSKAAQIAWKDLSLDEKCAMAATGADMPDWITAEIQGLCAQSATQAQSFIETQTGVSLTPTFPLTEPVGGCTPPGPRPKPWAVWWCNPPSGPATWASPKAIWPDKYGPGSYAAHPADLVPVYRTGVRQSAPKMLNDAGDQLSAGNLDAAGLVLKKMRGVLVSPFMQAYIPARPEPSPMSGKTWAGGFMFPVSERKLLVDRYNAIFTQLVEASGGRVIGSTIATDAKIAEMEAAGLLTTSDKGETKEEGAFKSATLAGEGLKLSPMTLIVLGVIAYFLFFRR